MSHWSPRGIASLTVVLLAAVALASCGGGGDGGGGNNPGTSGEFTLGASSASFSAREQDALPVPKTISVTLTGSGAAQLGAAFPAGQVATWLTVNITGGAPNYNLVLTVNTTDLSPAQRTATVVVGTADSSGNVLQSRQVTVTYDLDSHVQVASAPSSATLVFGSSQITQALSVPVTAPNKTWTITSDVPWLQGLPGGNQQGSQALNLTLNAANLAVNSYTGTLTVLNTADAADHASVTITLNVLAPTLTVSPNPVVLGGPDGLGDAGLGNTNKNLLLTLNTGTNTHPYTVVLSDSGVGWLKSSVPGGTVGSNAIDITLDADRSTGIQPGEYSGSARFDVNVNGTTFSTTVPVALNLESHRLVVENGVALSKFPSRQVLSRTLKVTSSRDRAAVPWRAQSNQSWLTVTQPGSPVVGNNLTLTANPAGLSAGQHIALVTLHSTDPTIDRDETIRVGFWIGSADPTDVDATLTAQPVVLVTNPVEPLAYVHTFQANIFVYNVYTGALQNTFSIDGIDGITSQIGAMSISGDGRVLYVFGNQTGMIYGLDAITGAQVSLFRPNPNILIQGSAANGLSYMRPNGRALVLTPYGETFDVETGLPINTSGGLGFLRSFSGDYRLVYSLDSQTSPSAPARSTLSYSALHSKVLNITGTAGAYLNGPGADICLGGTGSRVYAVPGGGYVSVLDPTTLANIPPQISHPSGVFIVSLACARNGNVYVGSRFLPIGDDDIQSFDASGASLGTFRAGPDFLDLDEIRLSGDETRFASGYERFNFGQFAIAFRSVPP